MRVSFLQFLLCASSVAAWTTSTSKGNSAALAAVSRQDALKTMVGGAFSAAAIMANAPAPVWAVDEATLATGVKYEVLKTGDGPKPEIGELIAIRFAAFAGTNKIDDIFETPEPYYTRLGSGGLISGVESTLPLMRVGDRWKLTVPGELAFGKKGRPASAGKPRIAPNAEIVFEVEVVGLPGKEPELIDLIGDVDE